MEQNLNWEMGVIIMIFKIFFQNWHTTQLSKQKFHGSQILTIKACAKQINRVRFFPALLTTKYLKTRKILTRKRVMESKHKPILVCHDGNNHKYLEEVQTPSISREFSVMLSVVEYLAMFFAKSSHPELLLLQGTTLAGNKDK